MLEKIKLLLAITLTAAVIIACNDNGHTDPPQHKGVGKVFFTTNAFDYLDAPNVVVNVYVNNVLIGTLTESHYDDLHNHLLNGNTTTSYPFAILYETEKDFKYRFEIVPDPKNHPINTYDFKYEWFNSQMHAMCHHHIHACPLD